MPHLSTFTIDFLEYFRFTSLRPANAIWRSTQPPTTNVGQLLQLPRSATTAHAQHAATTNSRLRNARRQQLVDAATAATTTNDVPWGGQFRSKPTAS